MFKNVNGVDIQLTAQEEADRIAESAAALALKSLEQWKQDMEAFKLSREMEEHIQIKHAGIADTPYQQAIYDAKIVRRGQKP